MDDLNRLKTAITLISVGLYEKEWKRKEGEYFYSTKLMHGINIFQSLNHKYNDAFDFEDNHEQNFIVKYAALPVEKWFENWKNTEEWNLKEQAFYKMDAMIEDSGFNTFCVSDNCIDYLRCVEKDIIAAIEQRNVYDCLIKLSQEDYIKLRSFLIRNPILKGEELRSLKREYCQNDMALKAIENAYEEIKQDCFICPTCHWTMQKEKIGMRCQSRSCSEKNPSPKGLNMISGNSGMVRLRRGVMKYIAAPGMLEMQIFDYCNEHKVESSLWPEMDKYDIEITFPNGIVWAIDAKAVKEPYFLREKIRSDGGFPSGDFDRGFYVIKDEYAEEQTDYLEIINRELKAIGNKKIRCIRLRELKKEIRERKQSK